MDAELIAELIAKRDAAKKDGDPSWVTFYSDQLADLQGMGTTQNRYHLSEVERDVMERALRRGLIAKRDAAAKAGHPSWVTFYTEQLNELHEPGVMERALRRGSVGAEVQQPDPLRAITKSVAELADVAVKKAEQSDTWLVEFERQLSELLAHTRKRIG